MEKLIQDWEKAVGQMNGLALALKEIAPAYSIRASNLGADMYDLIDRTKSALATQSNDGIRPTPPQDKI